MDVQAELQTARENVARLQAQKQQVDTLLIKWMGIAEYLQSKQPKESDPEPVRE